MGVSSPVTEKGRPQWEKDRALHYQAVNDKNVPQPCPLGPWALPDSQVRQAVDPQLDSS